MKRYLKQKVAKFLGEFFVIAAFQRVEHLVGLFDEVSAQGLVGLLAIPRAAAGVAQALLNRDQLFKPVAGRQGLSLTIGFRGCTTFLDRFGELFARGHIPSVESIECSKTIARFSGPLPKAAMRC